MRQTLVLVPLLLGLVGPAATSAAPAAERRVYQAQRATPTPQIDGRLDDVAWGSVDWAGEFVQREPADGVPPSKQTQFKVVYDDQALYFAFRAFDDPTLVRSLLSRRDRFPGDWVEVNIDSYFDHRTAFSFTLSLSGTRGDEAISEDGNRWDTNWDPVWEGATAVDKEGWTGEMRIPLNELRFSGEDKQTWGLQVQRRLFRQEERSTWQPIPKGVPGWVSRFGELRGLDGLKPRRRLELLPYSVAKAERFEQVPGDPFRDGGSGGLVGGLDGKLGVTSDMTLDLTLNPDFGQVEADPSQVNLTAFETFFEEKRPFFIEGASIFNLSLAPAITGGHFARDRLFYSRRIGGAPPHSPELAEGEYLDQPQSSSILGALKLSGKSPSGLSIGVLETLTSREEAQIDLAGRRRGEAVAPLTNYFVGRAQQDLHGGDTQLGLMFTSVYRDLDAEPLRFLTREAYAGGVDFSHYLGQRSYRIEGNLLASHLRGSPEAIRQAQESSARLFQRPDHDHATLDPTRTTLSGHAGSLRVTRTASHSPIRFQVGAAWRSPGFEINDVGFMNRADEVNQFGWGAYQFRNPFSIFRRLEVNVNEWLDWDFGGHLLRKAANANAHAWFKNNWRAGGGATREWEGLSNTALRGGPASRWPGSLAYEVYGASDSRRALHLETGVHGRRGDEGSGSNRTLWLDLVFRPTHALTLTLSPTSSRNGSELQYVDTQPGPGGDRYLFGRLSQRTSALTFRVDLSLSPNLTIQYYGAPFVSAGRYSELKRMVAPQAPAYRERFRVYEPGQLAVDTASGVVSADEDRDGAVDYRFDRPDFDFREFNSTLVARWEYRPGSLLYLIWSQARTEQALRENGTSVGPSLRALFNAYPHDVFLIKFTHWFSF